MEVDTSDGSVLWYNETGSADGDDRYVAIAHAPTSNSDTLTVVVRSIFPTRFALMSYTPSYRDGVLPPLLSENPSLQMGDSILFTHSEHSSSHFLSQALLVPPHRCLLLPPPAATSKVHFLCVCVI